MPLCLLVADDNALVVNSEKLSRLVKEFKEAGVKELEETSEFNPLFQRMSYGGGVRI